MKKKVFLIIILLLSFIILLNFSYIKSLFVMYFYNSYQKQNSIMEEKGFTIDMPGGTITEEKDWYPFVLTFNDTSISSAIGENLNLTILYNFGAFEDGQSLLYDPHSDYYSAFYGAYIIESKDKGKSYGFEDRELIEEEIIKIASHDIEHLVLKSIGCIDPEVTFRPLGSPRKADYISYENWMVIDAAINSQSPLHTQKKNHLAYLQYGKPPRDYQGEDFPDTKLSGRIYCRYFKEFDVTIVIYILAPSFEVIERTDQEILGRTVIHHRP